MGFSWALLCLQARRWGVAAWRCSPLGSCVAVNFQCLCAVRAGRSGQLLEAAAPALGRWWEAGGPHPPLLLPTPPRAEAGGWASELSTLQGAKEYGYEASAVCPTPAS